jgi:hypothetical protein
MRKRLSLAFGWDDVEKWRTARKNPFEQDKSRAADCKQQNLPGQWQLDFVLRQEYGRSPRT